MVGHLLQATPENKIMVFSSLNRKQELPAAAKQWKEGRPASPAHQPHHLSAPKRCLHGFPIPGVGQQRGDAAGLAGSQPGAQGAVGHHGGPRGGVEGRPHHLAELRHGVPGKMLREGVLDQAGISSIFISVFQSQDPCIIRECGCFHCVSQVAIVTKRHCLLFRECLSSAQTWAFVQPVAFLYSSILSLGKYFFTFSFSFCFVHFPPPPTAGHVVCNQEKGETGRGYSQLLRAGSKQPFSSLDCKCWHGRRMRECGLVYESTSLVP